MPQTPPPLSITVSVSFQSDSSQVERSDYRFAYRIRITNTATLAVQIVGRHWLIHNAHGEQQEVHGLGVVGQQPLLAVGETFEYTSGCHLSTATGTMQGSYLCVTETAEAFECPIPLFELNAQGHATPTPVWPDEPADPAQRVLH